MDGFLRYFKNGKPIEALNCLRKAVTQPESCTIKIDGAPALILSSGIEELPQPFVAFRSFLTSRNRLNYAFTSEEQIEDYFTGEKTNEHRKNAFLKGLELSRQLKKGLMLWGDVLFSSQDEVSSKGEFTPNTITYCTKEALEKDFGIVIHTKIENGNKKVSLGNYVDAKEFIIDIPNDFLVLFPKDLSPKFKSNSTLKNEMLDKVDEAIDFFGTNENANEALKAIKLYLNKGPMSKEYEDIIRLISDIHADIEKFIDSLEMPKITSTINGELTSGEGLVVECDGCLMKLVKDSFTTANKEHMRKIKERIESQGNFVTAWSSSKDPTLFDYYLNKKVEFGKNGGSNYLFASYLVTEPPFTEAAEVGYSDKERLRLYGENIFEFQIPTSNLMFFIYDEFINTALGKQSKATPDNFIEVQLKNMGLDWLKPEEVERLKPSPDSEFTSSSAVNFCKIMSRYFGQGSKGNLRTPCDGFEYKGKNDGKVLVVWNYNRLIPVRYSNDMGATWKDVDKMSPEYKAYVEDAMKPNDYKRHLDKNVSFTYDGNKTPEKEKAYRLLLKFNSNDGFDENGNDLRMADGMFYKIQIHDDKTIDACYRNNLFVNEKAHFYKMKNNQFLNQLFALGFRFGKLDCDIKIGTETTSNNSVFTIENIPEAYWPKEVTGFLKIAGNPVDNRINHLPTKFGKNVLMLSKCEIFEDCFKGWDVRCSERYPSFCEDPELCEHLKSEYDCFESLLSERPQKGKRRKKESIDYVEMYLKHFEECFYVDKFLKSQ